MFSAYCIVQNLVAKHVGPWKVEQLTLKTTEGFLTIILLILMLLQHLNVQFLLLQLLAFQQLFYFGGELLQL